MGNCCIGKVHTNLEQPDDEVKPTGGNYVIGTTAGDGALGAPSGVLEWEKREKDLNVAVMEKIRDDFHNRPDNFILNLLILSNQFYANFDKEKANISNHIRDRELAFSKKLSHSRRRIMYLGGLEEISGGYILYQPHDQQYMELPTPLQIYVARDNVDLYPEEQYAELQEMTYSDVDGPGYRFCTEYSNRHPGYVRLRCADIIPGVTRHNTYEDIYGYLKPPDESEPDPVVDVRPLRRSSLIISSSTDEDDEDYPLPRRYPLHKESSTEFEESDEDNYPAPLPVGPIPQNLGTRRLSGIMPHNYPSPQQLQQLKALKEAKNKKQLPNGDIGPKKPSPNALSERRPSGAFPKIGPEMKRLRLANSIMVDGMEMVRKKLAILEEDSEDEEEDDGSSEEIKPIQEEPTAQKPPIEITVEEIEDNAESQNDDIHLPSRINSGCFINRKLKLRDQKDAYGIDVKLERRTYLSSERYLECFEDEFEDLAKIIGKEHLIDNCQLQVPAVLANELMIEEIGPKYNTEFIPTLILKEWPPCSFEWKMRARKEIRDKETKMVYRWPKEHNIQEVVQMGCNLVPIGHYNPKEPNRVMKLEWQIQFTKGEQILLRSLGHTQVRLLLLVEYLLRDHLHDVPGLKNQHLRYILFYMCEHNFKDWHEARLGKKLKDFFKTLYTCLSTEHLPHYFIDKCNMMETIPERYLRQLQATVKKMKENLPVYLMHTMRQMRSESGFYPELDMVKLYKLVTAESFGIHELNPQLMQLVDNPNTKEPDLGEDVLYSDSEEEREAETKKKLHEMRMKRKRQATRTKSKDSSQGSKRHPTIRLDTKIKSVRDLRAGRVLEMFAKHFIGMARASNEKRCYPQGYRYLLMAGNMAELLDETGNNEEAKNLRTQIDELNFASRSGVQDILGSSWNINGQQDLNLTNARGSNWEMNKRDLQLPAPPDPPPNPSPIIGVERIAKNNAMQTTSILSISKESKLQLSRTLSDGSDDILPTDMNEIEKGNKNSETVDIGKREVDLEKKFINSEPVNEAYKVDLEKKVISLENNAIKEVDLEKNVISLEDDPIKEVVVENNSTSSEKANDAKKEVDLEKKVTNLETVDNSTQEVEIENKLISSEVNNAEQEVDIENLFTFLETENNDEKEDELANKATSLEPVNNDKKEIKKTKKVKVSKKENNSIKEIKKKKKKSNAKKEKKKEKKVINSEPENSVSQEVEKEKVIDSDVSQKLNGTVMATLNEESESTDDDDKSTKF